MNLKNNLTPFDSELSFTLTTLEFNIVAFLQFLLWVVS